MRSLSCGGSTATRISFLDVRVGHGQPTRCPDQEEAPVPPLLKLGHDTVDDVWFRGEDVYGVHVSLGRPAVLEALDVCKA